MRITGPLDLFAVDLLAAAIDHVLDASAKDKVSLAADKAAAHEIAGAICAVGCEGLAVAVRGIEIAWTRVRPVDHGLAHLVGIDLVLGARPHDAHPIRRNERLADGEVDRLEGSPSRVPVSVPSVMPY